MNEYRRAKRRKVGFDVDVTDTMTGHVIGKLSNLSETGMLLILGEALTSDALFQLRFTLNDGQGNSRAVELGAHELWSDEAAAPLSLIRSGVGLALMREDVAVPASERGELLIWPHARVAALLSFIYPKSAEHDPALVATLSVLRQVWGLSA